MENEIIVDVSMLVNDLRRDVENHVKSIENVFYANETKRTDFVNKIKTDLEDHFKNYVQIIQNNLMEYDAKNVQQTRELK